MRSRPPRADAAFRGPKSGPRSPERASQERSAAEGGALGRFRSPLYHQIYLIMRQRIADGEFGTGGMLPSEQVLAEYHGVSRITAKRALD
ncbi:MAG: GntR family transcriptional regulator, partial [Thalassobaculaceae bacterium]|nr:GntR family transcriptional regulator [Thalassobaculaceae bacterium]